MTRKNVNLVLTIDRFEIIENAEGFIQSLNV